MMSDTYGTEREWIAPASGLAGGVGLDHRALPCVGGYAPVGAWVDLTSKRFDSQK